MRKRSRHNPRWTLYSSHMVLQGCHMATGSSLIRKYQQATIFPITWPSMPSIPHLPSWKPAEAMWIDVEVSAYLETAKSGEEKLCIRIFVPSTACMARSLRPFSRKVVSRNSSAASLLNCYKARPPATLYMWNRIPCKPSASKRMDQMAPFLPGRLIDLRHLERL